MVPAQAHFPDSTLQGLSCASFVVKSVFLCVDLGVGGTLFAGLVLGRSFGRVRPIVCQICFFRSFYRALGEVDRLHQAPPRHCFSLSSPS